MYSVKARMQGFLGRKIPALAFLSILVSFLFLSVSSGREAPPGGQEAGKVREQILRFATSDDSDFEKLPPPRKGDWLSVYPEPGQSLAAYVAGKPVRPGGKRKKIVIQPLGEFSKEELLLLGKLREFAELYFVLPVELALPLRLSRQEAVSRKNPHSGKIQYRTDYILDEILKPRLPRDAVCYLGITMVDLYPEDSWNYVFGQASLRSRVGDIFPGPLFCRVLRQEEEGGE